MASHLEISPAAETATLRNSGTAGMDCFGCSDAAILGRPNLKLELNGVFKSWAVTNGPSVDPN